MARLLLSYSHYSLLAEEWKWLEVVELTAFYFSMSYVTARFSQLL